MVTRVSSLSPPGSCLQFLSRIDCVQQSHCSSIVHRELLTHALTLSASHLCTRKDPTNIYVCMCALGATDGYTYTYTRTWNTRDRSITHSFRKWVSTKSSISQLDPGCIFTFRIYLVRVYIRTGVWRRVFSACFSPSTPPLTVHCLILAASRREQNQKQLKEAHFLTTIDSYL